MNQALSEHPDAQQLAAFRVGNVRPEELTAIERHLADCPRCCGSLKSLPDDALVHVLRQSFAATALVSGDTPAEQREPPATATTQAPEDAIPPALANHPRYRVVGLLGAGGMGAVYKAEHLVMERAVALKVISRGLSARPAVVERFRREVKTAARLSHPNIVAAYDADQVGDTHFLIMEYVAGTTLARLIQERGSLPVALACAYVRQAALGLQHASEHGMVHRDVKPQNLMLTPQGQIKILDFGLARLASELAPGEAVTGSGMMLGTADYIAPEQAADPHAADVRADIYSLGCTLYFLLTGQPPFPEGTLMQKLMAHGQRTPRLISSFRADLPPRLGGVLDRMTAKDPARRYQTPFEVATALEPFTQAAVVKQPRKRRPLLVAAALAALFAGMLLAAGVVYRIQTDKGELVITTESDDVKVVITQGGKQIDVIDTKTDKQIALGLRSGVYELELKGAPEGLKLNIDKATLTRGETVLAKIERVAKQEGTAEQDSATDAIRLVHRVDWRTDGSLYGDAAARGRHFLATVVHVTGHPRGVRVWDGETGKYLWDHNNAAWARFSPNGDQVYVLEQEYYQGPMLLRAYRTTTGELVRPIVRSPNFAHSCILAADGEYVALSTGGVAKPLTLWKVSDGTLLREWGPFKHYGFAPDSKHFWVTVDGDDRRRQYRLPSLEEVRLPDPLAAFDQFDSQPAGQYAIAGEFKTPPESRWLVDADGRKLHRWLPQSYVKLLSSCDWINGRESLVSLDDGSLRLFDVVTQQERSCFRLPPGEKALLMDLSADRTFATAVTNTGAVLLLRLPAPLSAKDKP